MLVVKEVDEAVNERFLRLAKLKRLRRSAAAWTLGLGQATGQCSTTLTRIRASSVVHTNRDLAANAVGLWLP